jgi:exonuclease III
MKDPNPAGPRGMSDQNPPMPRQHGHSTNTHSKRNQTSGLDICTYNVRTLSSEEKLLELYEALKNIKFDILGLAETRRLGCEIKEYPDHIFCYIGQTRGLHGVGFLIKKELKANIVNFTGISERIALLQLKFDDTKISVIQAYAPTESSSDDELELFYRDLRKAHTLADDTVLVIGDFNAKIGLPTQEEHLVMGNMAMGNGTYEAND